MRRKLGEKWYRDKELHCFMFYENTSTFLLKMPSNIVDIRWHIYIVNYNYYYREFIKKMNQFLKNVIRVFNIAYHKSWMNLFVNILHTFIYIMYICRLGVIIRDCVTVFIGWN